MNKEQAKQILDLAVEWSNEYSAVYALYNKHGWVSTEKLKKEQSLYAQLEALVNSFVEEE